jgi:K(+)-stimulated pyrophosphate-energized sodium pump
MLCVLSVCSLAHSLTHYMYLFVCRYAFGISSMAILIRGMAGIFGKAAEVGSELIHKLEPEASNESSKNPASIADKTGAIAIDSVAMMIDIIDSLIITIVSAGFLAQGHAPRQAIPFWIAGGSFFSGLLSYGFVRCSNAGVMHVADRYRNMMWGLRIGMYLTAFLNMVWYAVIIGIIYTGFPGRFGGPNSGWNFFACLIIGTFASLLVWEFTSYFTAAGSSPTRSVAAAGITGASTMLIQGSGVGLLSALPMGILLIVTIISCGAISGQYGIALGALAYLCNCWFTIAANSIAPIAYAADSCVDQPETAAVREVTVSLHMAGESCAAEARGWGAIGAILAGFSALAAYRQEVGLENTQQGGTESDVISEGIMFACAIFGAFTPFFVAGINVLAIGKATRALVDETRRQFQVIGGHTDCNPESVSKATAYPAAMGALLPAFIVLLLPLSVGFLLGGRALSCFVAGAIMSGGIMGYFLSNAGATWVKSKTSIEAEGAFGGSGSDAHIASVIGTRMGSALKDVAAPTMITSMKAIAMTALLMAPLIFIDRTQPYFMTCLAKRWATPGLSTLACYDWNKAYWSPLPLAFLAVLIAVFYCESMLHVYVCTHAVALLSLKILAVVFCHVYHGKLH